MSVALLGIRHHGPGSARAVLAALHALDPDVILVEGPPEADRLIRHVPALTPPVAVLAHVADQPGRSAFWPFAEFSPEWQALRFGRPVSFIDLPAAVTLADGQGEQDAAADDALPADPLGWLSLAAGHDDPERWWEDVVEHRLGGDPVELFAAIAEAMTEVRRAAEADGWTASGRDLRREAAMRQGIRAALAGGYKRVAVVCGAWHVPALATLPPASTDAVLLRRLAKVKVGITWVPWTAQRLTYASGYGAGVAAPGWYAHLWRAPDRVAERWVAKVTALLREGDLPASPASAVEAVRLAEAVAAVRGRALPGLTELNDAVLAVLCNGDPVPLGLVSQRLTVGDELGAVPHDVPTVPLQADFEATTRRLRFSPAAADREVELDLRTDTGRGRSVLLHRLRLLDVPWGTMTSASSEGTFRETWLLRWQPEYVVRLIERARYGTTVEAAATAVVEEHADGAPDLPLVTGLVEVAVLADLPGALAAVTRALEQRSARTGDIAHLLAATPPLARVLRYGNVRQTATDLVRGVFDSIGVRVCAGLAAACVSLDDAAAAAMLDALEQADAAITLVGSVGQVAAWRAAQATVADLAGAPGLVAGRCVRLLLDAGLLPADGAERRLARALSAQDAVEQTVRWLEGFLRGSGSLLLRDQLLWSLFDQWLAGLPAADFDSALPLLRRAFSQFTVPERRQMGAKARAGAWQADGTAAGAADDWDQARVRRVLDVVELMLGD